jgi:pentatricopeptide repeat protein
VKKLLDACAERGLVNACEGLWTHAREAYPDVKMFNMVLKACVRARDAKRAVELLRNEQRRASSSSDVLLKMDMVTWNTALTACAKAGDVGRAVDVQHMMMRSQAGIEPDLRFLTTMIEVYGAAGDVKNARRVFYEDLRTHGHAPTIYCYAGLIKAYGNTGDAQGALECLTGILDAGLELNPTIYTLLIMAVGQGGRLDEARALYQEATHRYGPGVSSLHFAMLNSYARWGEAEHATALLESLEGQGVELEVRCYNALLGACVVAERYEECFHIVRRMRVNRRLT